MEITASMVKELRETTGAGMMDCKKALAEADGDMAAAVDVLRTKGLADLAKKAGRATNEGVIASFVAPDAATGVLVEVNCETDFVARNSDFKDFVATVANEIAGSGAADVAALLTTPYSARPEITIEQLLGEMVGRLGENMGIARFVRYERGAGSNVVAAYIHGVGNIGVLVEVACASEAIATTPVVATFARDVAMQVAAAAPVAVRRDEVPADVVAHEMAIYKAQAAETGKPEPIQEKIAQGRLEKYYKEFCLLEQPFVKDPDISVTQYAERTAREAGGSVDVVRFARLVLGETNPEPRTPSC